MRIGETLGRAAAEAAALILPVDCAGCELGGVALCLPCARALDGPVRFRGGDGGSIPGVAFAAPLEGAPGKIIRAMKAQGRTDLVGTVATPLRRCVEALAATSDHPSPIDVVTIPPTRSARRKRGWNVVDRLARRARLDPLRVLTWARQPLDQRALGRADRIENLRGALEAKLDLRGRVIIVADDVVTTGATIAAATAALERAGGIVLGGAVVAATSKRMNDT